MSTWYVAVQGQQQGPLSTEEVVARIRAGQVPPDGWVFGPGASAWEPIRSRAEFAQAFAGAPGAPPPPMPPPPSGRAHEIDYELFGGELQYVEITLDPQEACVAEAGSFFFMEPGIEMQTIFGDGSGRGGGGFVDKLLSAGKRVLTGESLFMTLFANTGGAGRQKVAFAAPYPGQIVPMHLGKLGGTMICQKDAFLCAAKGISVGIAFQRKLGAGFFGGEGFILQRLEGDGYAFVHACGAIVERELRPGETLRVDTGCLVAFEPRVAYDIQLVPGVKTALFGGEGLFFATLSGPGRVWLQSLPFNRFASRVFAAAGGLRGGGREEGSVLGGLGDVLMGD